MTMRLTPAELKLKNQLDQDPFTVFAKRDQYGRPVINDKPHRRPSSVAKSLDDAGGLVKWKAKMTAFGAAKSPTLLKMLDALDPDDPQAKGEIARMVDEIAEVGGAADAANYGSLIHALLEVDDNPDDFRWDYDKDLFERVASDEHFVQIRTNYFAEIDRLGFIMDPKYVEVPLVSESLSMAGTCDRITSIPSGKYRVFDVKTKEGRVYPAKFLGWMLQLYVYAQADYIFDPETDTRSELPDGFDPDWGYICAVDRSSTEVEVYEIDLRPAGHLIELAAEVEQARKGAIRYATKVVDPLPAGQTDLDVIKGRIAVLRDMDGFGLDQLMHKWGQAGLPAPAELTPEHWAKALEVTEEVIEAESVTRLTLDDALKRVANLPEDLRNGVEAHGKWTDRSVWESDVEAAQLQADVDVRIAERAYETRKEVVKTAAERISPASDRPLFVAWLAGLHIDVADPSSWTKQCIRSIDALSRAVELHYVTPAGDILEEDEILKAVRKKFGKTSKGPANEAFREAAKWLNVAKSKSYDAYLKRPEIVSYALCADGGTV